MKATDFSISHILGAEYLSVLGSAGSNVMVQGFEREDRAGWHKSTKETTKHADEEMTSNFKSQVERGKCWAQNPSNKI